ncbi:AMP-binding protein [Haloarcula marina]|uniref:AMP-binding protein n=1 Tax=Haloarcula marina TaxID=2961574 RepID=UPI0020B85409|nr:AMP-binding protein [Halomicroarcula marina]
MVWSVPVDGNTYEEAQSQFRWQFPSDFNAANDLVRKHDNLDKKALYEKSTNGEKTSYSFRDIDSLSDDLAFAIEGLGLGQGDRIAIAGSQRSETLATHLAAWKMGAISVPLSCMFGAEGIRYRLNDSGSRVVIAESEMVPSIRAISSKCKNLEHIISIGGNESNEEPTFESFVESESARYEIKQTDHETPAIIIYTSGTTGDPKGVLHTHGIWAGSVPAFYMYFDGMPSEDDVFWTPSDWAWIGSLGNVIFPPWHFGCPVVGATLEKFSPKEAHAIMAEFDVTKTFLPPTALRMMKEQSFETASLSLEAILSGSEVLTSDVSEWVSESMEGVHLNQVYGQTEAHSIIATSQMWFDYRANKLGKSVVGHDVAIVNDEGNTLAPGSVGEIAVKFEDDPVVASEYWGRPELLDETHMNGWHLTGDLGMIDEDGYIEFRSRKDDLIISSGYSINPLEIEQILAEHPSVEQAGVIGVPDELRGQLIKAFIKPKEKVKPSTKLKTELKELVREEVALYAYPREITFTDQFPTSASGKLDRSKLSSLDN